MHADDRIRRKMHTWTLTLQSEKIVPMIIVGVQFEAETKGRIVFDPGMPIASMRQLLVDLLDQIDSDGVVRLTPSRRE